MGNDIFLIVMNKKKNMILDYANILFKYTVNNKNKITKTLSSIIDIYFDNFYLEQCIDFSDLDSYFALSHLKDKLLKETISSTIKFYKMNNIGDKIVNDKSTIVIVSNVVYLSICLCNGCFEKYNTNSDNIIEQFFNKYNSKIRLRGNESMDELKDSLNFIVKKDCGSLKKAFKIFENTTYNINLKNILDYDNHYLVELNYELKSLTKYNKKEIEAVKKKSVELDFSIILLEQVMLQLTQDYLEYDFDNKYLVKLSSDMFSRQKYMKVIYDLFKTSILKKHIIFMLNGTELPDDNVLIKLKDDGFTIGLYQTDSLKINGNCFDNFNYVLVPQHFLEMHSKYQNIWQTKGINFIIS